MKNLGQRGSISIFGIMVLGCLGFLAAGLYTLTTREHTTSKQFLDNLHMQHAVENAAVMARAQIASNPEMQSAAERASSPVLLYNATQDAIDTKVFALHKGSEILLMATGKKENAWGRVTMRMRQMSGHWYVSAWHR